MKKTYYSTKTSCLALATVQYGISCSSKPEYARCMHRWQILHVCAEKMVQQRFIGNGLSTWMTRSDPSFTALYSILQRIQPAHGIDPAEYTRMEWWSSMNENWLMSRSIWIQMIIEIVQLIYAGRDVLQGTDAVTARIYADQAHQK